MMQVAPSQFAKVASALGGRPCVVYLGPRSFFCRTQDKGVIVLKSDDQDMVKTLCHEASHCRQHWHQIQPQAANYAHQAAYAPPTDVEDAKTSQAAMDAYLAFERETDALADYWYSYVQDYRTVDAQLATLKALAPIFDMQARLDTLKSLI